MMKPVPFTVTLNTHGVQIGDREQRHIDAGMSRLEAWTRRFPERSAQLGIKLHDRDGVHTVNLVLDLPNKTIVAHDSAPHLLAAVDRSFRKALRQLREHKAHVRREHLHHRVRSVRNELPEPADSQVAEAARQHGLADFRALTRSHVDRLRRFLEEETLILRNRRDGRAVPVEDLVEETLAQALDRLAEKPWAQPVTSWLYTVATEVLEKHLDAPAEPSVAIESLSDVPGPPSYHDDLYDGLHRLLFRGESTVEEGERTQVHVAEPRILRLSASDPAATAEDNDLRQRVAQLLAELPAIWRRSFLLHFVEGFDHQEIAQIQSLTEDQVRLSIHSAELFLHERLAESA